MQTFLPYPAYDASAKTLDLKRLGKQIMECGQILRALTVPTYGWKNHPATKMWAGYESQLFLYTMEVSWEWSARRGKRHGATTRILEEFTGPIATIKNVTVNGDGPEPHWLGWAPFHRSHQSNLVRKDAEHYRQFFPDVPDDLEYVWPTKKNISWPVAKNRHTV